jgi:hydrogenase nickel incorporation protein HypA/HybF
MHELSLAVEIMQLLETHGASLQLIQRFTLEVGALSCVDEAALRTALISALPGTKAAGADIVVVRTAARARCLDCALLFEPPDRIEPCPHCGSPRKQWLSGEALRLQSIEGL